MGSWSSRQGDAIGAGGPARRRAGQGAASEKEALEAVTAEGEAHTDRINRELSLATFYMCMYMHMYMHM